MYIKEICLSGGSHRGIAYLGTMKYLEEQDILKKSELNKIIGVSIGSYIGALYLIGFTTIEILELVLDTSVRSFKDISLKEKSSILKGEKFREWVFNTLSKKISPNITLESLYNETKIEFIVGIVSLNNGLIYASHKTEPNMKLYDVIMASMSIPFIFPPYVINNENTNDVYVDGGVLDNFPVHLLDENGVGIKTTITTTNNMNYTGSENIIELMKTLWKTIQKHINKDKITKQIFIFDVPLLNADMINLDITQDDIITLYKNGYNYTKTSPHIQEIKNKNT